jgi:hypothetical protein
MGLRFWESGGEKGRADSVCSGGKKRGYGFGILYMKSM